MAGGKQGRLFADESGSDGQTIALNAVCRLQTLSGYRVVTVGGVAIAQYAAGDRMSEAHAMVQLVDGGWADQREVARAFAVSTRTVRRHQRRYEHGGLCALGRPTGYPKGQPRLAGARTRLVEQLKCEGHGNREIARRIGVSEKAVRKLLARLGWRPARAVQTELPLPSPPSADPKLSAPNAPPVEVAVASTAGPADPKQSAPSDAPVEVAVPSTAAPADPKLSAPNAPPVEAAVPSTAGPADPNVSTSAIPTDEEPIPHSLDTDPADRRIDRLLACFGLLADAPPLFQSSRRVPRAGVLLAMVPLVDSGVFECAREVYGNIGPAFYGLRTTVVTLLLMALLRIRRPEALKEYSPPELGRVLGLDRAPEVKTLRRKLLRLGAAGRATEFGRALARLRVAMHGASLGFLYVDGHVRVYHGKRDIPKTHVARMRIAMPGTTDYWVNDTRGDPLLVITAEANAGMTRMLPIVLSEARALVGERRITVVFDRGGWSPRLFRQLIADGFDILTYRKGRTRAIPRKQFQECSGVFDGRKVRYMLADRKVRLLQGTLELRQVTSLSDDGKHQTHIITSRTDLAAVEVAFRMFERWRQENFFKYLREEYALDALVDHAVEPDDATREVPNPKWAAVDAQLRAAQAELAALKREIGADATLAALGLATGRRSTAGLERGTATALAEAVGRVMKLEQRRAAVPRRIPVGERSDGVVVKLATERKHLSNVLKMVAYQAESELVRSVAANYRRSDDEGRTLVQAALGSAADIEVTDDELRVTLAPQSAPHRTAAIAALCRTLDQRAIRFPGTRLTIRYTIANRQ